MKCVRATRARGAQTLVAFAIAWAGLLPAQAQQAGVYLGNTSQGSPVVVYVDPDDTGTGLVIGRIELDWEVACPNGQSQGHFVSGAPWPLVSVGDQPVRWEIRNFDLFLGLEFEFIGDGSSLRGQALGNTPAFARPLPGRKPAQLCSSGPLQFEASIASADAVARWRDGARPVQLRHDATRVFTPASRPLPTTP